MEQLSAISSGLKDCQDRVSSGLKDYQDRMSSVQEDLKSAMKCSQKEFEEKMTDKLGTQLKGVTEMVQQQAQDLRGEFSTELDAKLEATRRELETQLMAVEARARRSGVAARGLTRTR
jgi:hypothetical protein